MFTHIRWRLVGWTVLVLGAMLLALGAILYASLARSLMDALDERSIAAAIDDATTRPDSEVVWLPRSSLAADVMASVARVVSSARA